VPVFERHRRGFGRRVADSCAANDPGWRWRASRVFGGWNVWLLVWNLRRVGPFLRSERGAALAGSQRADADDGGAAGDGDERSMSASSSGSPSCPACGAWSRYLFPAALVAFALIGVYALRQLGAFLARHFAQGGFDVRANNSFGQMMPAFTLAMVGVGLAAPGAMSATALTAGVSMVLSTFFLTAAVVILIVGLVLGLHAMLEHGAAVEQAPTLLIVIPITTVLGILLLRQDHGLHVHFESHSSPGDILVMLSRLLSVEVLFGLLGLTALRATGYIRRFVTGGEVSVGAYALICPGVALSVMLHFWINKGLVGAGLIAKFGAAYWALTALALASQAAMIVLFVVLYRRHFLREAAVAVPAE
jgi:hypothetical protein